MFLKVKTYHITQKSSLKRSFERRKTLIL